MGVQQQQAGNYGEYCVTEQVDGMSHFFTIALDHRLQFCDILRCDFSLDKGIKAIQNRQHPDNKIKIDIHKPTILTQLNAEQY